MINAVLLSMFVFSQSVLCFEEHKDSIKTYPLHEVVITATKSPLNISVAPSRVYQIDRQTIEGLNGSSVGEIIGVRSGVFTREYGVGGSLQTMSFRGMGAEQTLVLLDGVPINNVQTGLTDLRLISLDYVEQIEIVRGGNSALYGADALGGVINILTDQFSSPAYLRSDAAIGSFGARRFAVASHLTPSNSFGLTFGSSTEYGSGNYPFTYSQTGSASQAIRSNSDYHSTHLFIKSDWHPNTETQSNLTVSSFTAERGTPGPLLTVLNQGTARQADDQFQAVGSFQTKIHEGIQFIAVGNFQNAYERYVDATGLNPADNYYRNTVWSLSPQIRYSFDPSASLISGIEFGEALANGNALNERQTRFHTGAYLLSEFHSKFDSLTVSIYPSLRFDSYNPNLQSWSPKMGMNVRSSVGNVGPMIDCALTIHSTVGKDFRVPTFNEYYYAGAGGYGNPLLQPERSLSFDIGITLGYDFLGNQDFDISYYSISTENRILWLPTSMPFIVSPKNIGKTLSAGLETEFHWRAMSGYVELEGSYSLLDARKKNRESPNDPAFDKQLPYVPLETGNLGIKFQIPLEGDIITKIFSSVNDSYIGERYVVEGSNEILAAHHLVNGNIGFEFRIFNVIAKLKYEINNVTNIGYEVMPRYPMPLRNQTASLSIIKSL